MFAAAEATDTKMLAEAPQKVLNTAPRRRPAPPSSPKKADAGITGIMVDLVIDAGAWMANAPWR
jgi:hypothetical protein